MASEDETARSLERKALTGDREALDRLRVVWARQAQGLPDVPLINCTQLWKEPLFQRFDMQNEGETAYYTICIQQHQGFHLYAMSVIPDAGQPLEALRAAWNYGELSLAYSCLRDMVHEHPLRTCMPHPGLLEAMSSQLVERSEEVQRDQLQLLTYARAELAVAGRPLFLHPTSVIRAALKTSSVLRGMIVFYGIKADNPDMTEAAALRVAGANWIQRRNMLMEEVNRVAAATGESPQAILRNMEAVLNRSPAPPPSPGPLSS